MKIKYEAWAAGIIDGEGCITISRQRAGAGGRINPSHRLYVKVSMGHLPTIDRLHEIFGAGSRHVQPGGRWNDAYIWMVSTRQAGDVLRAVRPHLVTKADEADLALEFLALPIGLTGGARGNAVLPPKLVAERERLFVALRDAKPSARFRAAAARTQRDAVQRQLLTEAAGLVDFLHTEPSDGGAR